MQRDPEKKKRLFKIAEGALILGLPHKTLSQWLIRRQWTVNNAHPTIDSYRLSYSDLMRAMLVDELSQKLGIPAGQGNELAAKDPVEGNFVFDWMYANSPATSGAVDIVDELIDGNPGVFVEKDSQGNRLVLQADALVTNDKKPGAGRYCLKSASIEDCAKSLATLVIRLDLAEEMLDARILAAEAKAGVLGIRVE